MHTYRIVRYSFGRGDVWCGEERVRRDRPLNSEPVSFAASSHMKRDEFVFGVALLSISFQLQKPCISIRYAFIQNLRAELVERKYGRVKVIEDSAQRDHGALSLVFC